MASYYEALMNEEIMSYMFAGNLVKDYVTALAIFLISLIILRLFKFVFISKLKGLAKKTKSDVDDLVIDLLDRIRWPFYMLLSFYVALQFITVPDILSTVVYYLLILSVGYYLVRISSKIIDYIAGKLNQERKKEEKGYDPAAVNLLSNISKAALWVVVVILVLSNLGYEVSALLAGMGIGGIAIAFALQAVLSDIFASFSIHFDKPFKIGDFIVIGEDMGTVKKVGIKSTRLRSLEGEELVISNKELTESRIRNFKKMKNRRISFNLGITYETPSSKLKKIPKIVKDIINKSKIAEFERAHFHEFGDFSLIYQVVYVIKTPDYNKYMDLQQNINLAIKEKFEKEKIGMAYPTQTIYLSKTK